ncbi:hypothetical protein BGX34_003722 [Mortierella sp. NVP85]|nr:hypothetical protein BGX34_003722 [Mortierella sp. NVP85]
MDPHPDDPFLQTFRCRSTGEVLDIPTILDPTTGERMVFWEDILSGFKNAESVRNGKSLVSFLRDENQKRIEPLRIAYHPGVELEITIGSHINLSPSAATACNLEYVTAHKEAKETDKILGNLSSTRSIDSPGSSTTMTQIVDTLSVAHVNDVNQSLVASPTMEQQSKETGSFLMTNNQQYDFLLKAIKSEQGVQMTIIKQSMDQRFDLLQIEMTKNKDLQEQTNKELLMNQENILRMQLQALERLTIIQSRVQAVLTQTYELHEYPIPRLFIVLPKINGASKIGGLFWDQFRLYFLCECGLHTMSDETKTPHEIHLAKHEGYDLNRPGEFFERYGPYILTMMNMVKFGFAIIGAVMRPFAMPPVTIPTTLVDNAISFLNNNINEGVVDLAAEVKALEGADLRQIRSYLHVKDPEHTLGNLFRVVTPEGHVKWVCLDHYREDYAEQATKDLQDIVFYFRGRFVEETGRIEVRIPSHLYANVFYEALVKARRIQELDITLEWDAIMADFQALAKAVTTANVIDLTVNGTHFKGPATDVFNRKQRFNPIMKLVSNARIQYLRLKDFDAFFHRVSKLPLAPYAKLRVFSMESGNLLSKKAMQSFNEFLEHQPPLTTLCLKLKRNVSFTTTVSGCKPQDVGLTAERVNDIHSDDLRFIQKDLTRLMIKHTPQEEDEGQLTDTLCQSLKLCHLQIGCDTSRALAIVNLVISIKERIMEEQRSSSPLTFELMEEMLVPFNVSSFGDDQKSYIQSSLSFAEDTCSFDMRTWIRLQDRIHIKEDDPIYAFVRQYGWSIVFLDEGLTINDRCMAIMDVIPDTRISQLESLCVNVRDFGAFKSDHLGRIIERSPDFKDLGLHLDLGREDQFEMAASLLSQYGTLLSRLQLYGESPGEWLPRIASLLSRASLPNLTSFGVWLNSDFKSVSTLSSQSVSKNVEETQSTRNESEPTESWKNLRKVVVRDVKLQPEEWETLLNAVDFSELQHLDFKGSNFSQDQFRLLIACIPGDNPSKIPLKTIHLEFTEL